MGNALLNKKIQYLKNQLLDLGKRNKMINYRETKRSTLKLTEPGLSSLFQRLVIDEDSLTFKRAIGSDTDYCVYAMLSLLETVATPLPVTVGDIGTEGSLADRVLTLRSMRNKSRLAFEEQGTNILYLSIGFIEWSSKKTRNTIVKSPLVLVPVQLILESINSPYILKKTDDEIVVNPTLSYLFQSEYGIDLPEFDSDTTSIDDYLDSVSEIANNHGWRVIPESSLGLMSFLKINMYKDLINNLDSVRKNPIIRALAGEDVELLHGNEISDHDKTPVMESFQVLSADSSQMDAIEYSKHGSSFVMQGPPGTGKSQTIANMIAEGLATGKKILFVSEKMAALQVVYRRLQDVGLADFCLPLHNYKANKKDILMQIASVLDIKRISVKREAFAELDEFFSIRNDINEYPAELHQVIFPLGMSCYEVYGEAVKLRNTRDISFEIPNIGTIDSTKFNEYKMRINRYAHAVDSIDARIDDLSWKNFIVNDISVNLKAKISASISECIEMLTRLSEVCKNLSLRYNYTISVKYIELQNTAEKLKLVSELPPVTEALIKSNDILSVKRLIEKQQSKSQLYKSNLAELLITYTREFLSFDSIKWLSNFELYESDYSSEPTFPKTTDELIYECKSLYDDVKCVSAELKKMLIQIRNTYNLIGIECDDSIQAISKITALSGALKLNGQVCLPWLNEDNANNASQLVALLYQLYKYKFEYMNNIRSKWDIRVCSIPEYNDIAYRYNQQYHLAPSNKFDLENRELSDITIFEQETTNVIELLSRTINCIDEINYISKCNFSETLSEVQDASNIARIASNGNTVLQSWFCDTNYAENILLSAEKMVFDIRTALNELSEWNVNIASLECENLANELEDKYSVKEFNRIIKDIPVAVDVSKLDSREDIKKLIPEIIEKLNKIIDNSQTIDALYTEISQILCVDKESDSYTFAEFEARCKCLDTNIIMSSSWFDEGYDTLRSKVEKASREASAINDRINTVLSRWEKEIFDLPYNEIIYRFRTEYTNIFKIFKSNYSSDKKSVRALYKLTGEKFTDQTIIDILTEIKAINTQKEQFFLEYDSIGIDLAGLYNGLETDWNTVIYNMQTSEQIKSSATKWGKDYIQLLCSSEKRHLAYSKATSMISNITACKKSLLELLSNVFDIETNEYNNIIKEVKETKCILQSLFNGYKQLRSQVIEYFGKKEAEPNDESMISALKNAQILKYTRSKLNDMKDELHEYVGNSIVDDSTDWDNLKQGLETVRKIKEAGITISADQFNALSQRADYCKTLSEKMSSYIDELKKCGYSARINEDKLSLVKSELENIVSQYRKDRDILSEYYYGNDFMADELVRQLISDEAKHSEILSKISKEEINSRILGSGYNGENTDWDTLISNINKAKAILTAFPDLPQEFLEKLCSEEIASISSVISECAVNIEESLITIRSSKTLDITKVKQVNGAYNSAEIIIGALKNVIELKETLSQYCISEIPSINIIRKSIRLVEECHQIEKEFVSLSERLNELIGNEYVGMDTDWEMQLNKVNAVIKVKNAGLPNDLVLNISKSSEYKTEIGEYADTIESCVVNSEESIRYIDEKFGNKYALGMSDVSHCINVLSLINSELRYFDSWFEYLDAKSECNKAGLGDFITKIESGKLFGDELNMFVKAFYISWLNNAFETKSYLSEFRRSIHDEKLERFRCLDSERLKINQARIREKLISCLPDKQRMLRANDEMSILLKEMSKKRRIMPLRKLFSTIPNVLLKLKPCLMMSPLSVSYFLNSDVYQFDMVIFDEASQILPEDAIGAIFRGKQVIIAGDSKQLPPTNFFNTGTGDNDYDNDDNEDIDEVISDSILEEAANSLPNKTLLWHYRSRHEHLIAFSNREIYNNELITFPNCVNGSDLGVEYYYVEDGVYEGGGRNCNIREAERCVMLIKQHFDRMPERSLGVIAFSEKQQHAIENAVNDFRLKNPWYEQFFSEDNDEPFFIKNLENVQGDERDTIIFSICYAKTSNGRMYMRFGPLGHAGGERRLNVAVTRAKYNIKLVGSILPSDIDLSRTRSEGVKLLRTYIEFAMKGETSLSSERKRIDEMQQDEFCNYITTFVESMGYKVQRNAGCSNYTIDIAVYDTEGDGYIAGIECDGISYISARTAGDREHLRYSILKQMGWNLYRVWSTAWIKDREAEEKKLAEFLKSAQINKNNIASENNDVPERAANEFVTVSKTKPSNTSAGSDTNKLLSFATYTETYAARYVSIKKYSEQQILLTLAKEMKKVIITESPIHRELLYKRLAPVFNQQKVSDTVKKYTDYLLRNMTESFIVDKEDFVWCNPRNKVIPRIPKGGDSQRPIEYIPYEEIGAAMLSIISNTLGITTDELIIECASAFGYERKGPKIKVRMSKAIDHLIDHGEIQIIDENKIKLIGG